MAHVIYRVYDIILPTVVNSVVLASERETDRQKEKQTETATV